MVRILVFCIAVLAYFSSSYGNVVAPRSKFAIYFNSKSNFICNKFKFDAVCGGRVFVDEPVVIDAPIHEDCIWEFQTKEDRVLLFTLVDGNLKEAQEFFKVSESSHSCFILINEQIARLDSRWTRQRVSDSPCRKSKDSRTFQKRFASVRLHDPIDGQHPIHKSANFKPQTENSKSTQFS